MPVEFVIVGAAGAIVSRVMTTGGDDAGEVLSAASVAVAVKELSPSASATFENEKDPVLLAVPLATDTPPLNSSTTELASAVPTMLTGEDATVAVAFVIAGAAGAVVSSVMTTGGVDAGDLLFAASVALAVKELAPSASATLENVNAPKLSAVAVPKDVSPLNSSTTELFSAVPTMLTGEDTTVAVEFVITGAAGGVVSGVLRVMTTAGDAGDVLPTLSVALAVKELSPSASATFENEKDPVLLAVPLATDTPPLNSSTVELASAVPTMLTGEDVTVPVEFVITGAAGAVVSSVMTTGGDDAGEVLSAASVAVAVKELAPSASATLENVNAPKLSAVTVPKDVSPLNSSTTELASAVPTMLTGEDATMPVAFVIAGAAGAVVSRVMTTGGVDAGDLLFAASVAVAVKELSPSASATLENVNAPKLSAVAVPKDVSPLNSSTTELFSAVPTMLTGEDTTVAVEFVITGAAGGVVSGVLRVMTTAGDAGDVLPTLSVALAVKELSPSASATFENEKDPVLLAVPLATDTPPLNSSTVELASAVPTMLTGEDVTVPVEFVITGAAGAVVSSVMTTGGDDAGDLLFAASVAVAVKELAPSASATLENVNAPKLSAVTVPKDVSPLNSSTTELFSAVPTMLTGEDTTVAVAFVIAGAAGAVVSRVMTTGGVDAGDLLFAASVAVAVKELSPSASATLENVNAPKLSAVAVPKDVSPLNSSTTELFSAVPTMLTGEDTTVAVEFVITGAAGGVVSGVLRVMTTAGDAGDVLPTLSVALAVKELSPSASATFENEKDPVLLAVPLATDTPPLNSSTVELASAVPTMLTGEDVTVPVEFVIAGAAGAVVSRVMTTGGVDAGDLLFAASVAVAVKELSPSASATLENVNAPKLSAVAVPKDVSPLNSSTTELFSAVPTMLTGEDTTVAVEFVITGAAGAVVSRVMTTGGVDAGDLLFAASVAVAVKELSPSASATLENVNAPKLSAVAVPKDVSPLNSSTTELFSAVPTMLTGEDTTVAVEFVITGAAGGVVSGVLRVMTTAGDAGDVLPTLSVALAVKELSPSASATFENEKDPVLLAVPLATDTPPLNSSTVELASAVPTMLTGEDVTVPVEFVIAGAAGAVVSRVMTTGGVDAGDLLFAASVAVAVKELSPSASATLENVNAPKLSAVAVPKDVSPLNSSTTELFSAVPTMLTGEDTTVAVEFVITGAAGGVVSGVLRVMTTAGDAGDVLPTLSVALAVKELSPSASATFENEKDPVLLAVPLATDTPPLNSSTVELASAVPTMLTGEDVTVPVEFVITGAAGAVVSRVMTTGGDAGDLLFAASVAVAVKELAPSASATLENVNAPKLSAVTVPKDVSPLNSSTTELASAVPTMLTGEDTTVAVAFVIAGAAGAVVSRVMTTGGVDAGDLLFAASVAVAVKELSPSASATLENVNAPKLSAVAVPKDVSPLNSSTTELFSAVPTMLTGEDATVAVAFVIAGAAGGVVSGVLRVMTTAGDAGDVLPTLSVALAVKELSPSASATFENEKDPVLLAVPLATDTPPLNSSTVELASAVPTMLTGEDVTVPVEFVITGAAGAVVSRVMTTAGDAGDLLFAASVAVAVKELAPSASATLENVNAPKLSAVTVPKDVSPLNSSTTELASAVPTMLTGEDVTVPVEFVIAGAAGAVVSSVMTTGGVDAGDLLFAASVAVAVKELAPSASATLENVNAPKLSAVTVPKDVSPLNSSTTELASAVPTMLTGEDATMPVAFVIAGAAGAVVSSVMTTGGVDAGDLLFAASVALAVKELAPSASATLENVNAPKLSAVAVPKDVSPLNSSTTELFSAVPTMLTGEDTTVAVEFVITGAAGGVVSGVLRVMTTAGDAGDVLPTLSVALAVKELSPSASATFENEKDPVLLAVPLATDTPPLNSSTTELASAVPTMLTGEDVTVPVEFVITGAAGAVVSRVMTTGGDDAGEVLSAASVAVAVKELAPSASATLENVNAPKLSAVTVPKDVSPLNSSTTELASAVPTMLTGEDATVAVAFVIAGAAGAVVSRVMTTGGVDAGDLLFAASVAVAVKELAPSASATLENVNAPKLSAVAVPKDVSPLNSSTTELFSAVPTMLTGEDTTVAVEFVITGAAGGVVSGVLRVMTTAGDAGDVLPTLSVALAVKELSPSASATFENEKDPVLLAVPLATDTPPLNSSTVELTSAVPTMLTGEDVTVPVEFVITGAAGAVVSRVMTTAGDAGDLLFAASVAVAVKELAPSDNATFENEKFPELSAVTLATDTVSLNSSTSALSSVIPIILTGEDVTMPVEFVIAGSKGGVLSTSLI